MTIAVGLMLPSSDLIIGADTQETTNEAKLHGPKIMAFDDERDPPGCVVFTGAGDSGYLDSLGQKLIGVFRDRQDLVTPRELGAAFEDVVARFYKRHIIPFGSEWVRNEQLGISAMIAYQRAGHRALFRTEMASLTECSRHAVGTGQLHALGLLNTLGHHPMITEVALRF